MRPRTPRATATAVLLVTLAALGTAGCTVSDDTRPEAAPQAPRSAAADAPTPEPTPETAGTTEVADTPAADPSTSEPTPATSPSTPTRLADRLLPGAEMPGPNETVGFADGGTSGSEPAALFGRCHRFAMTSIGAMRVVVRDYAPTAGGDDVTGRALVAQFADEKTAASAVSVLRAWRDRCGEQLRRFDAHDVGALTPVDAGTDAAWYLLSYGPPEEDPDARWFDAEGWVRVGTRVALLRLVVLGQDYNYEPGQEPLAEGLRRAAARL